MEIVGKGVKVDRIEKALTRNLDADETALVAFGAAGLRPMMGFAVITNRRLLGISGKGEVVARITISEVSFVEISKAQQVHVGTHSGVSLKFFVPDAAAVVAVREFILEPSSARSSTLEEAAAVVDSTERRERLAEQEGVVEGRLSKFRASMTIAKEEAQAASRGREQHNHERYGGLVIKKNFGMQTVEIYEAGFVRVGVFVGATTQFEALRSIKFTSQVRDGDWLFGGDQAVAFLTITTDRKVHTLKVGDAWNRDQKAGMALEAAGRTALDSNRLLTTQVPPAASGPTEGPDVADQIRKLAELHAAGILTDEEFSSKKAELLDRI